MLASVIDSSDFSCSSSQNLLFRLYCVHKEQQTHTFLTWDFDEQQPNSTIYQVDYYISFNFNSQILNVDLIFGQNSITI